jgi:arginyl-tRNA synthetase
MTLPQILTPAIEKAVKAVFDVTIDKVEFQTIRKEFEGDITMVIFPLLKLIKSNPVESGNKIGNYLVENLTEVSTYNVVSGLVNIVISDTYYLDFSARIKDEAKFGFVTPSQSTLSDEKAVLVEYSSPNTNKSLHLGYVRNNLLGYSVAEIIKASGKKVYKTQIINDRGIYICKSMLAWQKFGNGQTPESTGLKGDKLMGNYYVAFDKVYKEEIAQLIIAGHTEDEAKKQAPIIIEAQEMLLKWEAGDDEVIKLTKTKAVRKVLTMEFYVMMRTLGRNFMYSGFEIEQMKLEIVSFE